jgi:hypothetical protein
MRSYTKVDAQHVAVLTAMVRKAELTPAALRGERDLAPRWSQCPKANGDVANIIYGRADLLAHRGELWLASTIENDGSLQNCRVGHD